MLRDLTHRLRHFQSALRFSYLALVVVVSCKSTEPKPVSLAGSWNSVATGVSVGLVVTQSGRQLSGSVSFHDLSNDALGGCELTGTYTAPSVALIFSCGNFGPARFDGAMTDAKSLSGTMIWGDGRQFSPFRFALTEQ